MQANSLSDYIRIYDNSIEGSLCDQIVKRFEAHGSYDERRTDTYSFDQIICNITPGFEEIAFAFAELAGNTAHAYFDSLGLSIVPAIKSFEHVRIKRYTPGRDYFNEHVDVSDHASARRFLVCMTYLSDNQAGETAFPGLGEEIYCRKGSMVVFPPLWLFPHQGRPPVGQPKYTICTLLHYS